MPISLAQSDCRRKVTFLKRFVEGEARRQVTLLPECLDAYVSILSLAIVLSDNLCHAQGAVASAWGNVKLDCEIRQRGQSRVCP